MVNVWVVTGCSNGLGKEICLSALSRGDKVIATCRGDAQFRLAHLAKLGADVLSLDVTAPVHEIQAFACKAIAIHGRVDIVCNNAGYLHQGGLEEISPEEASTQFQTTFFGPMNIARAFLPHMRARRTGVLCMIGSSISDLPVPGCGVYIAAKAAIAAATLTLASEVESFNIKAICIDPGEFRTEVFATPTIAQKRIPEYKPILEPILGHLNPDFKQPGDPHKAAERIVDLLTGAGKARGKKMPSRIMLGDDAYGMVTGAATKRVQDAKEWKEWSTGTNLF